MPSYAVRICQIGCPVECKHGHPCVVGSFGGIDRDHPHPVERGREQHFAMDADGELMHEWNGQRGKCKVYDPAEC